VIVNDRSKTAASMKDVVITNFADSANVNTSISCKLQKTTVIKNRNDQGSFHVLDC